MNIHRALSLLLVSMLLGGSACVEHPMTNPPPSWFPSGCWCCPTPTPELGRNVDLLFVIDNSGSMADEQALLRQQFPLLMSRLRAMPGGLPNIHLGVTSTDLGTGMFQITYCEEFGGDAGALLTGACANPTGASYIVDVEPQSCQIDRAEDGIQCTSHTCSQSNCASEPSTTFAEDTATGCPRCRNYQRESLEDVFSCVANLGTMGCGFEQPLEAMYRALDPSNTANHGFVRENAYLAVVLLTDEDDCSASNPQLFDNTQTDVLSTLGPLTSNRCFEFGITCDINSRTHTGTRQDCLPREDGAALLHPISRYIQFLQALKDPQMLLLSAIAGPVTPSPGGTGFNVVVGRDDLDQPLLEPSCSTSAGDAVPAVRVHSLIQSFNDQFEIDEWAYTSVCSPSYARTLIGLADKLKNSMTKECLPAPLQGCSDPGVEYGTPQAAQTCAINSRCLAQCNVTDVFERGLPGEARYDVPPCLEVAPDGTILGGNTNRAEAYAGSHPNLRDPNLPVPACWHIGFQPDCTQSNFAELRIARRADPPPRTFAEVACRHIPQEEQLCDDQVDNDEDCRVDMDDPCCANPANCELQ